MADGQADLNLSWAQSPNRSFFTQWLKSYLRQNEFRCFGILSALVLCTRKIVLFCLSTSLFTCIGSSTPRNFFGKNWGGIGDILGRILVGDAGVDIVGYKRHGIHLILHISCTNI